MKSLFQHALFALLLTALAPDRLAATDYTAISSGNWDVAGTWNNGVPAAGNSGTITIPANFTVTIPANTTITLTGAVTLYLNSGSMLIIAANSSQLTLSNTSSMLIAMNGSQFNPPNNGSNTSITIGTTTYANSSLGTFNNDGINNVLSPSGPLPIELVKFGVRPRGSATDVRWQTASECDVRDFEVERSADGQVFEKIGEKAASRGCSAAERNYSFTDLAPAAGPNFYRLRTVDVDGSESFSEIEMVESRGAVGGFTAVPSVVSENFTLENAGAAGGRFFVRDMAGRLVGSGEVEGRSSLEIDASGWRSGVYQVVFQNEVVRLVKI